MANKSKSNNNFCEGNENDYVNSSILTAYLLESSWALGRMYMIDKKAGQFSSHLQYDDNLRKTVLIVLQI